MAGNNANVSSVALTDLQSDLRNLSSTLHDLFDTMNADMSNVKEFWQDQKYQDFVNGYTPQINKCEEISQRYNKWCSSVLQEAIDKVVEIEMANVGMDGGVGVSAAGGGAAVTAAAGGVAGAGANMGKFNDFNTKGNKNETSEVTSKIDEFLKRSKEPKPLSKADKKCIEELGAGYRGRAAKAGEDFTLEYETGDRSFETGKVNSKVGVDFFGLANGEASSEMVKEQEITNKSKIRIVCEPNK